MSIEKMKLLGIKGNSRETQTDTSEFRREGKHYGYQPGTCGDQI